MRGIDGSRGSIVFVSFLDFLLEALLEMGALEETSSLPGLEAVGVPLKWDEDASAEVRV